MSMFEAYTIAVRVRMIDGLTTGLLGFGRSFGRVHGQAAAFHQQLNRIQVTAMGGLGLGLLGAAMVRMFAEPTEAAMRYERQIARLTALGNGPQITGEARHFAEDMRVPGVSRAENMQLMTDAMMVTRSNLHESELLAPRIARVQAALAGLYGDSAHEVDSQLMDLMRFAEFRGGLQSAAAMDRELNVAMRLITMSGNRIQPRDLVQFMKTGGVAATNLDGAAILAMEPLLQEMGGQRLGTATATTFNRLQVGIGLQGASGDALMRYGLIDPNLVDLTPEGRFRRFRAGTTALREAELARTDYPRWVSEFALPTARERGATDGDLARIFLMGMGRTGGQIPNALARTPGLQEQARAAGERAYDVDQAYELAMSTPMGRMNAIRARHEDLMLAFGMAVLPMVNAALEVLVPLMESAANWAFANPNSVKAIATVLIGIGSLALVSGTILLLGAAFSGIGLALRMVAPALNILRVVPFLLRIAFSVLGGGLGLLRIAVVALAGVIGWPAVLIGGLIIALTALGVWLYNNVAPFRNAVDGIIGHIQRFLDFLGRFGFGETTVTHADGRFSGPLPEGNLMRRRGWVDENGVVTAQGREAYAQWRSQRGQTVQVSTEVNMDGRRVASVVSEHQGREAQRPPTGPSTPNARSQPMPVAAGQRR